MTPNEVTEKLLAVGLDTLFKALEHEPEPETETITGIIGEQTPLE